jgi:ParB family chromosome partitioning protein
MKRKKFKSPLINTDAVSNNESNTEFDINSEMNKVQGSLGFVGNVMSLNAKDIENWEFRDRHDFEIGNIDALADSIKLKGQAQPIIVVRADSTFKNRDDKKSKYIVIAGYRRWLACRKHDLKVDAVIKILSFNDAISLLEAENEKEPVSDYSKGMFYSSIIKSEKIKKDDLRKRLGLQPANFSNLLSFDAIPKSIWEAVSDVTKVSARTAYVLRSYVNKDKKYIPIIESIAGKIVSGAGEKRIKALIEGIENGTEKKKFASYTVINGIKAYKVDSGTIQINKKSMTPENLKLLMNDVENYLKSRIEGFI